jgi:hypothetical protein
VVNIPSIAALVAGKRRELAKARRKLRSADVWSAEQPDDLRKRIANLQAQIERLSR